MPAVMEKRETALPLEMAARWGREVEMAEMQIAAREPNAVTVAAMREAKRMENDPAVRRYTDVEEALRELKICITKLAADLPLKQQ